MPYSEDLAERMRGVIGARDGVTERNMFGGISWRSTCSAAKPASSSSTPTCFYWELKRLEGEA
jgi:hypothetical protein